jgi:hypothetical protein
MKKHYESCGETVSKEFYIVEHIDLSSSFVKKDSDLIINENLTKLGLIFNKRWGVFICKNRNCNSVMEHATLNHLLKHGIGTDDIDLIEVEQYRKDQQLFQQYIKSTEKKEPIEGLPIYSGFKCQYCDQCYATKSTMEVHNYTVHRIGRDKQHSIPCAVQKYSGTSKCYWVDGPITFKNKEVNLERKVDEPLVKVRKLVGPKVRKSFSSKPHKEFTSFAKAHSISAPIELFTGYQKQVSDLEIGNEIMTQYGLIANRKEQIWICKKGGCDFVISSIQGTRHAFDHFLKKEQDSVQKSLLLTEAKKFLPEISIFEQKLVVGQLLEPVEGIQIEKGLKCLICNHCQPNEHAIRTHFGLYHGDKTPNETMIQECFFQRYFGKVSPCYEILCDWEQDSHQENDSTAMNQNDTERSIQSIDDDEVEVLQDSDDVNVIKELKVNNQVSFTDLEFQFSCC